MTRGHDHLYRLSLLIRAIEGWGSKCCKFAIIIKAEMQMRANINPITCSESSHNLDKLASLILASNNRKLMQICSSGWYE